MDDNNQIIHNDREYIQQKTFIRIYVKTLDVIHAESLVEEVMLFEEKYNRTSLEGFALIEGLPLAVLNDTDTDKRFYRLKFQLVPSTNIYDNTDLEKSKGYIYFYEGDEEPEIRVETSEDIINRIVLEFQTANTQMEIGFYINAFIDKVISKFESDNMLEKHILIDKPYNAILANFAIRRAVKEDMDEENKNKEYEINDKILLDIKGEVSSLKEQVIFSNKKNENKGIADNIAFGVFILIGWSIYVIYRIYTSN